MINIYTYDSGSPLPGVDPPTANKINGVMKDDTIPGDGLGMPVDKRTYRDMYYAHIAVMNAANIAADNTEEGATQSQFLDAVKIVANLPAYTVNSQASFNALFTRTSANVYDINASITSVVFKPGNYLISGILSGGDTWGDIQTNNCISLKAENGTTIDFAALRGKLLVETENCLIENIHVTGSGAIVTALDACFEVSAGGVLLKNCKASSRTGHSATLFTAFFHSGTALQKATSKFQECSVFDCFTDGGTFHGFNSCQNLDNPIVHSITSNFAVTAFKSCENINNAQIYDVSTTVSNNYGFNECLQLTNCKITSMVTTGVGEVAGFISCNQVSSCKVETLDGSTAQVHGFKLCKQISGCRVTDIQSASAASAYGFSTCERLSGCYADAIDNTSTGVASGFNLCLEVSACKAYDIATTGAGTAYGFSGCERLSGCYAEKIDTVSTGSAGGFLNCKEITSCKAIDIDTTGADVFGFSGCNQISGCRAEDIDTSGNFFPYGFYTCNNVSACYAYDIANGLNRDAMGFESCVNVSGCTAEKIDSGNTPGSASGFRNCDNVSGCTASDIDSPQASAYGFILCDRVSSCYATSITGVVNTYGFGNCNFGAAIHTTEAANANNDWMDSADAQITNNYSVQDIFT